MPHLLIIFAMFCAVNSSKIALFVSPMSSSHVMFTIKVAEELAKNHDIVIIRPTVNPATESITSKHSRVREIRTKGVAVELFNQFKELERNYIWSDSSWQDWRAMSGGYKEVFSAVCTNMINDDAIMTQLREEKFDFALAHHLDLCPVATIHALRIPGYGFLLSTPLVRTFVNYVGIPMLPSVYPSLMMDASNEMNMIERFQNFLMEMFMSTVGAHFKSKPIDAIFRKKYGDDFPSTQELVTKAKFLLANVNPDVEFPVPVTSKVTYFGGLGMSNESKPLQEPYASFVGSAKSIVFISFGSVADPKMMPVSWKKAFVELFKKNSDVHFIWRMENDVEVPKNVLRNTWHPQSDILAHPKTAAFITHAGYNSLGESIASGTPIITVPLFGDQFRNSRLAEFRGFGVRVDKTKLNVETLNAALHKIIDNPSYKRSAQSLRNIVFSSPFKAGDALRHAVNFAIEYPDHNRDLPALNFVQLYSLDVIVVLVSVVAFFVWINVFLIKRLLRCTCRVSVKDKFE